MWPKAILLQTVRLILMNYSNMPEETRQLITLFAKSINHMNFRENRFRENILKLLSDKCFLERESSQRETPFFFREILLRTHSSPKKMQRSKLWAKMRLKLKGWSWELPMFHFRERASLPRLLSSTQHECLSLQLSEEMPTNFKD